MGKCKTDKQKIYADAQKPKQDINAKCNAWTKCKKTQKKFECSSCWRQSEQEKQEVMANLI